MSCMDIHIISKRYSTRYFIYILKLHSTLDKIQQDERDIIECNAIMNNEILYFEKNLLRVAWSPDSQMISAGSSDKFLYIWEVEAAKIAFKLPGHTGSVNDIDFHPSEPISKCYLTYIYITDLSLLYKVC
jgi:WD40 repeat protein